MATIYKLGLIDAPWKYDNEQQNDPKRGGITYPTLSMEELYTLPLGKAFAADSILFVWVTFPKLVDSFYEQYNPLSIIHHWGFRPVTVAFVWVKLYARALKRIPFNLDTEDGSYYHKDDFYSGLGRYTNSNVEVCIVARKGKGLPRVSKNVKQLIFSPIRSHSAKPQEQYQRIEALYGSMNPTERIEFFARKINPPPATWSATGLDYDGVDIKNWIKLYG